jgi:hypothetical protein
LQNPCQKRNLVKDLFDLENKTFCKNKFFNFLLLAVLQHLSYNNDKKGGIMTTKRYTMDLPNKEHRRIRAIASLLGLSMKEFFLLSVEEFTHKKLNKTTEKTLKNTDLGKGLRKFKTLQEMFDDLGI